MPKAYLLLGSNIQKDHNIKLGMELVKKSFNVIKCSKIYETRSTVDQNNTFLNVGMIIKTEIEPLKLRTQLLDIEKQCGRKRVKDKNSPRTLDIDLCLYDRKSIKTDSVVLPDPDILLRYYMIHIFTDLDPFYILPDQRETLVEIKNKHLQATNNKALDQIWVYKSKKKKTALITGAAKRIGAALAISLAENDYNLILHYYESKDEVHKLRDKLTAKGVSVQLVQEDFATRCKKIYELFDQPIDVLINNASFFPMRSLQEETYTTFQKNYSINFSTPFFLIQSYIKKQPDGHIINMLDTAISKDHSNSFVYLLAKRT